jgi:hypothetical protein
VSAANRASVATAVDGRWTIKSSGAFYQTRARAQYGLRAQMGLLDDAIREHLELKRLRGADPGAVAREEQDALGPVRREGEAEHGGQSGGEGMVSPGAGGAFFPDSESSPATDSSTVAQETIEINMEAELAAGTDSGHEQEATRPKRAAPVTHPAHTHATTEESLEWEVPSDRSDESAGGAGSEDEPGSRVGDDHEAAEHVEDVLEETPDFLRDTPEQERLWFEQRPPRDFDFNE